MIKGWNKIVAKVAKQIFDKTQSGLISDEMVDAHAKHLLNGMFGKDAFTQPIGIKDNELAQISRDNVYFFSGAKNAKQLKEFNALLHNADGSQKQFSQFLNDVKAVDKTYNKHYLKAEYNHAISSSLMMQQWQRIVAQSESLPFVKFRAVIDGKTTNTCRTLNGIVKRWDDPFLDIYAPQNHFNCRLKLLQMASGTVTPDSDIIAPEIKPLFRNNVGKTGIVFPEKMPYFDMPKKDLDKVKAASLALSKVAMNTAKIKPLKNLNNLNEYFSGFAVNQPEYFNQGFKEILLERKASNNGSTDMRGKIWLKKNRVTLVIEAINNINNKLPTTFEQEDAISTLHHEFWHNAHKNKLVYRTKQETLIMELANEFVSRKTLIDFMQKLGGKLQNESLVSNRTSTSYNRMVRNYDKIIEWAKADKLNVLEMIKEHLINEPYDQQIVGLTKALYKNSSFKITEKTFKELINAGLKYNETDFEKILERNENLLIKR